MAKDAMQPAETSAEPKKPVVYPFRRNGTDRVYEVDAAHVKTFISRKSDLTYIGTIPLPKGADSNETTIK